LIPSEIIKKKRDGEELSTEELKFFIEGYLKGKVADYQVSAWCMAVYFKGMSPREIRDLVEIIGRSGKLLDLSDFDLPKVDKHSTGGVGDKTSITLVPLMASCGFLFPKLAGRGLGYTGGTIDKIESIPGFRTNLCLEDLKLALRRSGAIIAAQTEELAPADKKIYALRDVTATVDSIPLIVSSILGKKLAVGADAWVFDVKVGKGAFMKEMDKARELATFLISISKDLGKRVCAFITDMDQPLGNNVGNTIEVEEAIDTLKGKGPADLTELVLSLGSELSTLANKPLSREELYEKIVKGEALQKLADIIEAQGGDPRVLENYNLMPHAPYSFVIEADKAGFIESVDAEKVGLAVLSLGGGRKRKGKEIDRGVGIRLFKKRGDKVEKGEAIAEILYRSESSLAEALQFLKSAYSIGERCSIEGKLIYEKVL